MGDRLEIKNKNNFKERSLKKNSQIIFTLKKSSKRKQRSLYSEDIRNEINIKTY